MNAQLSDQDSVDELLRAGHAQFLQPNPRQRQTVLDHLGKLDLKENSRTSPKTGNRVRWSISLAVSAAVLLVGLSIWLFSIHRTAYGIDDLPKRLVEVQSFSLRGSMLVPDSSGKSKTPLRVPIEMLVKRPGKFRHTYTGISFPDKKNQSPHIDQMLRLCDGRQVWFLQNGKPTRPAQMLHPLDAQLKTENFAQSYATTLLLGPADAAYQKVGEETIRGRRCVVYEAEAKSRMSKTITKVWIDPSNGYPVRLSSEDRLPEGSLSKGIEFTDISINTPLSDDLFVYHPPQGQSPDVENQPVESKVPETLDASPIGSGSGSSGKLEVWYALRISDQAALLVWRRSSPKSKDRDGNPDWLEGVTFNIPDSAGDRSVRHAWLHESNSADRWNWSLVVPADGKTLSRGMINLTMAVRRMRGEQSLMALRFPDNELQTILTEARRATLTDDAREMSLEELRTQARELFEASDESLDEP